jgi:hypothetical protein
VNRWLRCGFLIFSFVLTSFSQDVPKPDQVKPDAPKSDQPVAKQEADKLDSSKKPDPFFTGPAFSLQQLVQAAGAVFEERLIKAIQSRGISFYPDQEAVGALSKAGASEKVLDAVRQATAPAPPQPVEEETNDLSVKCEPVECEVLVDGIAKGSTTGGALTIPNLRTGRVKVAFRKQGYLPVEALVDIAKGPPVEKSVTLGANPDLSQQLGRQLWRQILATVGGRDFLTQAASVTGSGTAVVFDSKGQRSEWSIIARFHSGSAYFKMAGAGLDFTVVFDKGTRKASKSFAKVAGAVEIENDLRLFIKYQLNALIASINGGKYRLLANVPPEIKPGGLTLRAETAADRYQVTAGDNFLPASVRFESAAGLGSGLQVLYADYLKSGNVQYPKQMVIKLPDAPQHGVEFQFSELTVNAPIKEKDFR